MCGIDADWAKFKTVAASEFPTLPAYITYFIYLHVLCLLVYVLYIHVDCDIVCVCVR